MKKTFKLILSLTLVVAFFVIFSFIKVDAEEKTFENTFDFTKATSFDDLDMFSVGVDPHANDGSKGYTSDSWVTYAKNLSDVFTLENGLKINKDIYVGSEVSENRIYVRYNAETMKYFEAELKYSYDDSENGWAGLFLGYTNYERQARWGDSPCGAEFFTQKEGKGTYSSSKLNNSGYTEGNTPAEWTINAEHVLRILADETGIKFYIDDTLTNSLSTEEMSSKGFVLTEGSIGFMFTNAQFSVKSFSFTNLEKEEEVITYDNKFDFTTASSFEDLNMFSVGVDPHANDESKGYTSDEWVTYAKNLSDVFTLENGLKINKDVYVGSEVSENRIYVRYNGATMNHFEAELTYSYDDTENGWAGLFFGYTNFERQVRWVDSPNGAEFFVQKEGKGTYSNDKLNNAGYTEGAAPSNWTINAEHTIRIVADETGVQFYADGTLVNILTTGEMSSKGFNLGEGSIGFMFTNAQFTVKSFKFTSLKLEHTPSEAVKENEVAASCKVDGSYDLVVYCSVCGVELSRETEVLDASDHVWGTGEITKAPTCTEVGVRTYTCDCGETKTEEEPIVEHSYSSDWNKDAANHWHECSCGDKKDVAEHTWDNGQVTKLPTCTEKGIKTYKCKCGELKTEEVPLAGHSYSVDYKYDTTNHWVECGCGDKKGVTQHSYGAGIVTKEATTEAEGEKTFTCLCGQTYTETIAKLSKTEEKGGCRGSIVASVFGVLALAGSVVVLKKKRRD
jgi:hypothetical protein